MERDDTTRLIEGMIALRRSRVIAFPFDLFGGEQPWDMLLQLFLADARGEQITSAELIRRSQGSPLSGSRWIRYLCHVGLAAQAGSSIDDDVIAPTPEALERFEGWSRAMLDLTDAVAPSRLARA
jgi:hypothetical protein